MAPVYSTLTQLECSRCATVYDARELQGTCKCGAPLLACYDLDLVTEHCDPGQIASRAPDLWRYHELLPVSSAARVITLGEGMTPLLALRRLGAELGVSRLMMKDEGLLPTGSFKARGAATGVSRAAELGASGVAMPTNGNAGAAWAAYAARAGLPSLVVMPKDAPEITRSECVAAGAETYLVDGLIGDAAQLVRAGLEARAGYQDVSTLKEPYRLEGKKTIGLEIAEQLGWRVPDVIVCPVGGGVALIGIAKALRELHELGWIDRKQPRLVAVQAAGCAPVVQAFEAGSAETEPWPDAQTEAFGLTVPAPLGGFLVLRELRATGGTAVAITDEELLASQRQAARAEGTWICPEGAACFAAVRKLREEGWLAGSDEVVIVNTGAGLKYPQTLPAELELLPKGGSLPPPPPPVMPAWARGPAVTRPEGARQNGSRPDGAPPDRA
jgi:threonine synthase